jgi:ribose transport system ATP-binding protein
MESGMSLPRPSQLDLRERTPSLRVEGVSKSFSGTRVLDAVDLHVRAGEVHAVVGQNGSGKSTLVKILAGFHRPDSVMGAEASGQPLKLGDAAAAHLAGWRFVHQDLGLVSTLDTVDNLAIGFGYITGPGYKVRWRLEAAAARKAIAELGYHFDVRKPVIQLAVVERTAVAIARALQDLGEGTTLLVLDEPTATMPRPEVERLLSLVRRVRQRGIAVLYISHHLEEVLEAADRVTVLRDGAVVDTRKVDSITRRDLIEMMTGAEAASSEKERSNPAQPSREPLVQIKGVSGRVLHEFTRELYTGEVLGVAGITGSGRDELCGLLFGGRPRQGTVNVAGSNLASSRPDKSVSMGIGYIPADRHSLGLIMDMSIRENMTLVDLSAYWRRARLQHRAERKAVAELRAGLSIRGSRDEAPVSSLSGGNQQKVSLGKWIRMKPRILLLDEPTQGVDVGSQAEIHSLIDDIAAKGSAVLVCSSDEAELERLCDRVIVLRHGRIVAELHGHRLSSNTIVKASLGTSATSEEPE